MRCCGLAGAVAGAGSALTSNVAGTGDSNSTLKENTRQLRKASAKRPRLPKKSINPSGRSQYPDRMSFGECMHWPRDAVRRDELNYDLENRFWPTWKASRKELAAFANGRSNRNRNQRSCARSLFFGLIRFPVLERNRSEAGGSSFSRIDGGRGGQLGGRILLVVARSGPYSLGVTTTNRYLMTVM